jgi:molybdopterin molybdotransferase
VSVLATVPAGVGWDGEVGPGAAVAIMTGAVCPRGADAIVRREDVRLEGECVRLPDAIRPGVDIEPAGGDCHRGARVANSGQLVTPMVVASLASFGRPTVRVHPRPRLAIITTGDELLGVTAQVGPGKVHASNGAMLESLAGLGGIETVFRVEVDDVQGDVAAALKSCSEADIVAVTGGTGPGCRDVTAGAIRSSGGTILIQGLMQRPGKSMLVATIGNRLVLALPGTPRACLCTFWRYALPAGHAMAGFAEPDTMWSGRLESPVARKTGVHVLVPAEASILSDGTFALRPLPGRSGGDVFSAAGANALIDLEPGEQDAPTGSKVSFLPLRGLL